MMKCRPIRFALLISSLMAMLGVSAAAQTPNTAPQVHPLTFVKTAAPCVVLGMKDAPKDWRLLLQRTALWSLLYGTSLAEGFANIPIQRPATCAADMKRLAAELPKIEATIFAPGWRKGRTNPPANALMNLDPAYTAGWCVAVAQSLTYTAENFPTSIGLNRKTEEGRKQIAGLRQELVGLILVMDDWELESKAAPLQASNLRQSAGVYASAWEFHDDETDKAVLSLAGIPFAPDNDSAKWFSELIARMKLNVELGTCRAAAKEAKFRLEDKW